MPDSTRGGTGFRSAWDDISADDRALLSEVVQAILDLGWTQAQVCEAAGVDRYPLRRLLARQSVNHLPGLRLLHFAAQWTPRPSMVVAPEVLAKQIRIHVIAGKCRAASIDNDYFFRHLERLKVVTDADCEALCNEIEGEYYSYRLSRNPGKIIRSHYKFYKYNIYNRLPHFVNRLNYGTAATQNDTVRRTAQGQMFLIGEYYVTVGFVSWGYVTGNIDQYDGIQLNLFPAEQFRRKRKIIDGLFVSYVYTGRYEMGCMKLVRGAAGFDPDDVGEFQPSDLRPKCSDIDSIMSDLMITVPGIGPGKGVEDSDITKFRLIASLAFALVDGGIKSSDRDDKAPELNI